MKEQNPSVVPDYTSIPTSPVRDQMTVPLNLRVSPALKSEIEAQLVGHPGMTLAQSARDLMAEGLRFLELRRRFPAQIQAVTQLQQ